MRLIDLHAGSLKTLLILGLLVANIVLAVSHHRANAQPPGNARDSRAAFGDSPNARATSDAEGQGKFSAESPKTARGSRALPNLQP